MENVKHFVEECHNTLLNSPKAYSAHRYLSCERSLTKETLVTHKIGYCEWGSDIDPKVRYFGEDLDDPDKKDWQYNMWGRIIVPIYDEFGEIVSLATKKPAVGKNPWWNLPFVKSNVFYLLDKAKKTVFTDNKIYIVEGYVDALTMYQHGVKNVVALMGTALTLRKISLIARYCNNVCFCFDVDENMSGQKALSTSVEMMNKYCFCDDISVINDIPIGEDPASFVSKFGIDEYLSKEKILTDKEIKQLCEGIDIKIKEESYAK